jgi:hypothetical protein
MISVREHLKKYGRQVVSPSRGMLRYWCRRLNVELFDDTLPMPGRILFAVGKNHMAECALYKEARGQWSRWDLYFTQSPMSRAVLLEILAHELVHAAVALLDGDQRVNHGSTFMAYAGLLADRCGLPLRDGFYGEPEDQ